jgi:hypothetical protein
MQSTTGKQNSCMTLLLSLQAQLVLNTGGLVLQTWVGINCLKLMCEFNFFIT